MRLDHFFFFLNLLNFPNGSKFGIFLHCFFIFCFFPYCILWSDFITRFFYSSIKKNNRHLRKVKKIATWPQNTLGEYDLGMRNFNTIRGICKFQTCLLTAG